MKLFYTKREVESMMNAREQEHLQRQEMMDIHQKIYELSERVRKLENPREGNNCCICTSPSERPV